MKKSLLFVAAVLSLSGCKSAYELHGVAVCATPLGTVQSKEYEIGHIGNEATVSLGGGLAKTITTSVSLCVFIKE